MAFSRSSWKRSSLGMNHLMTLSMFMGAPGAAGDATRWPTGVLPRAVRLRPSDCGLPTLPDSRDARSGRERFLDIDRTSAYGASGPCPPDSKSRSSATSSASASRCWRCPPSRSGRCGTASRPSPTATASWPTRSSCATSTSTRRRRRSTGSASSSWSGSSPSAMHLRLAYSTIKINLELERVGDYAESIARQLLRLSSLPAARPASASGSSRWPTSRSRCSTTRSRPSCARTPTLAQGRHRAWSRRSTRSSASSTPSSSRRCASRRIAARDAGAARQHRAALRARGRPGPQRVHGDALHVHGRVRQAPRGRDLPRPLRRRAQRLPQPDGRGDRAVARPAQVHLLERRPRPAARSTRGPSPS